MSKFLILTFCLLSSTLKAQSLYSENIKKSVIEASPPIEINEEQFKTVRAGGGLVAAGALVLGGSLIYAQSKSLSYKASKNVSTYGVAAGSLIMAIGGLIIAETGKKH